MDWQQVLAQGKPPWKQASWTIDDGEKTEHLSFKTFLSYPSGIPASLAVVSIVVLLLQLLYTVVRNKIQNGKPLFGSPDNTGASRSFSGGEDEDLQEAEEHGLLLRSKVHFQRSAQCHGGTSILVWKLLRLLGCFTLVVLSLIQLPLARERMDTLPNGHGVSRPLLDSGLLLFTYLYAFALAAWTVIGPAKGAVQVPSHLYLILLSSASIYIYRDVWPLATYTLKPIDQVEGPILWLRIAALAFTAGAVPLFTPRRYIPLDPEDPQLEINPEQTAPWISFFLFSFMTPSVMEGYRNPHLDYEKLPPICDYDRGEYIAKQLYKAVYPWPHEAKRHMFWGIMSIYWRQYVFYAAMIALRVMGSFGPPAAINQLLSYLETGGKEATVRPWFWCLLLFLSPMLSSFPLQLYAFSSTRMMVHVSAVLTQLIFDHSLKIRLSVSPSASASESTANMQGSEGSLGAPSGSSSVTVGMNEPDSGSEAGLDAPKAVPQRPESPVPSDSSKSSKSSQPTTGQGKDNDKADSNDVVGKINNLIAVDVQNITDGRDFLFVFWYTPIQVLGCGIFLYKLLGWSALVGIATLILLCPLPGLFTRMTSKIQVQRMKQSDARTQHVTEVIGVIRMIKLFAWEKNTQAQLSEQRDKEVRWIRLQQLLMLCIKCSNYIIPVTSLVATFGSYALIQHRTLDAATVFPSIALFDLLKFELYGTFDDIPKLAQAYVSLNRVNEFLKKTPLLDEFTEPQSSTEISAVSEQVTISNATFTWTPEDATTPAAPSHSRFRLKVDGSLLLPSQKITLIIGPTGSGKTSFLSALLGEMHFVPSGADSYFKLPREEGIAYAAQDPWVQNQTIQENILLGSPLESERYKKVLYQCALLQDLELFEAGDQTEVGERGLTLSGGQKARISLARAVYSSAKILLLDDVLAALDVHTAKWVTDKCFKGDLLQGRTVLLVTHNVALASPIADFIVRVRSDGRITTHNSLAEVIKQNPRLLKEAEVTGKQEELVDEGNKKALAEGAGKLIAAEEIATGRVGWSVMKLYITNFGGVPLWSFVIFFLAFAACLNVVHVWYLGLWARQYEMNPPEQVNVTKYLTVYACIILVSCIAWLSATGAFVIGSVRASRRIYRKLTESLLGTTLRWLDTVPTSRVIARCTQDIRSVDGPFANTLLMFLDFCMYLIFRVLGVLVVAPAFVLPTIFISFFGVLCAQVYIKGQLSVKRELSNARSPVLGHFGAAIAGLASLRAYGIQGVFLKESYKHIDKYTRCSRNFHNFNRWMAVRIDFLGACYACGVAIYMVYLQKAGDASNTGFAMNMAVSFSDSIMWFIRNWNNLEIESNCLERLQDYVEIEQEPKPTENGKPPAYWPASGNLEVQNLSAKYSSDGPEVLHNLSFSVKSGERIGVVGRTGSGKSTLTLSLLRGIMTSGTVLYDGMDTSKINLDALRSNITIIPQHPELVAGTMRQNLDPFDQMDDATLNNSLEAAGLFSLQAESGEAKLTLDSVLVGGGSNLSVGQRQILALARAILRNSKLLILDEATSAIDYATDKIIQESIRRELKDAALITIAHRLQTIMDADRVLVLSAGCLIEYDSPANLLKKSDGLFRELVDKSNDKDILYEIAFRDTQ